MKFKFRIILNVLLLMFLAFIISGVFNSKILTREIADLRKQQIENTFYNYLSNINKITGQMVINGQTVSRAGEMVYKLYSMSPQMNTEPVIEDYLKKSLKKQPDILGTGLWYEPWRFGENKKYLGTYAFWKNDSVKITWEYNTPEYDYPNQPWYTIAIPKDCNRTKARPQDILITQPYMDKLGDKKVIFITLAGLMYDENGSVLGISSTDWSLDVIQNILSKFYITPNSFAFLIDKTSKNLLYHADTSLLMKNYTELSWGNAINPDSVKNNILQVVNNISIDNSNYDIYYAENNTGFIFGFAVNKAEAYSVVDKLNRINFIVISIILVIATIILYLMISRLMLPLKHLTTVVKDFSELKFDSRAKIVKNDEVGALAKTFNKMAGSIVDFKNKVEEYNQSLEEKVKERTLQLNEKNEELTQQQEELLAQSELLAEINHELEKLSIAASETDNAIFLMDAYGNFEWVNNGFTRMYGYSYGEWIEAFGENIIQASSNPEIKELLQKCMNEKITVSYESRNVAKNGDVIWAQTTITPIIDENEITRLVAIDSDISRIKYAEEEIASQRDVLHEQNKNIRSSIYYAQTIQQAILPEISELNKYFNTWLIYRPKDIVSGDFYWYSHLPGRENLTEKYFFATVDCTGHGVPGAFMSLIGNRILTEIVNEQKVTVPSVIIEKLHDGIIKSLKQSENSNNDGMDICLVKIEKENAQLFKISYSGAKIPLTFYSQDNGTIEQIKANRVSLGGHRVTNSALNQTGFEFYLRKNDILFLHTDGIIDQNNEERYRFGTPNFLKLLNNIVNLPFDEQKQIVENQISEFMQNTEQRDDITLLAIKL